MEKIVAIFLRLLVQAPLVVRMITALVGCIFSDLLITSGYPITALFMVAVSVLFFLSVEDD